MPYGFQDPLSDVDGLQVASAGPGDRLLPAREESPAPEPSRLSLEYPPRGESRSFAGTSDEFLREAPRRAASIRIDDSEAGEAAGFGVSGPRRSVETMGDEREVLTARGRAGGAQAELQNAILGTRADKERLDLAEKVLLERRKILPRRSSRRTPAAGRWRR
jgi:hypothetical protein